MSILEICEELARYNSTPDSEQALSDDFDCMLDEIDESGSCSCGRGHVLTGLLQDEVAFNEFFHNWKDGKERDGVIHESQCNAYGYIGKHENSF